MKGTGSAIQTAAKDVLFCFLGLKCRITVGFCFFVFFMTSVVFQFEENTMCSQHSRHMTFPASITRLSIHLAAMALGGGGSVCKVAPTAGDTISVG